jgi:hypothetical protein
VRCLLTVAAVLLVCSGCGGDPEDAGPARAAQAFEDAVGAARGAAACELLAPETKSELEHSAGAACAEAILDEDLPEPDAFESAAAFGTMAIVRFAADTLFVSEFDGHWRVLAAGCAPLPHTAYDCAIQGG